MKQRLIILSLIALFVFLACPSDEGELVYTVERPDKNPPKSRFPVRMSLHVDTENITDARRILREAGNYYVEVNTPDQRELELPYFDYLILSGGTIKQGSATTYLDLSANLKTILNERSSLLKPLRGKGIKILVGITGGGDGISFGSLANETEQVVFAQQCADTCKYYELDGVEFYDIGGESLIRNPYPEVGEYYFDGIEMVRIPDAAEGGEGICEEAWKKGAAYMTDMMSYLIEMLGAGSSFQGDVAVDHVENAPILVREVGYGRRLPPAVPRYDFSTTLSCVGYSINNDPGRFGISLVDGETDELRHNTGESYLGFVGTRRFAPMMVDLSKDLNNPDYKLDEFSNRFGTRNYPTDETDLPEDPHNSVYGMVYYENMQVRSDKQTEFLSVTSRRIFNKAVIYRE